MNLIYIDIETRSSEPIKNGLPNYMASDDFEIVLISWAIDDGPVTVSDLTVQDVPQALLNAVHNTKNKLVCHNSIFERTAFNMANTFDMHLTPNRFHDTLVQALAHGLPGGLGTLSKVFNLDEETGGKLDDGKKLIKLFAVPQADGTFLDGKTNPVEWDRYKAYATNDVRAMRTIYKYMPKINYPTLEHRLWCVDQSINDRGIPIDVELAEAAIRETSAERERLNASVHTATGGEVAAATQRDKLLETISHQWGVTLPDLRTSTVERRLADNDLPTGLRRLLEMRLQSSQNSSAKYASMIKHQYNGRVHNTLQMYGASRTGRDAGRIVQPQNLKRPTLWRGLEGEELDAAIEDDIQAIKEGIIDLCYPDRVMEALGSCVRSAIVAPEEMKIVQADLSNIEGRALVWLSDESWKLEFFRAYDAKEIEYDNYIAAYAKAFGIEPSTVTKKQRQIGKVMELALGYGGGVIAFLNFVNIYGMDLDELSQSVKDTANIAQYSEGIAKYEWALKAGFDGGLTREQYAACEYLKNQWRAAHPKTTAFWKDLENGFRMATGNEGTTYQVGLLKFKRVGAWLYVRLPSGRCLTYPNPQVDDDGTLSFMGMDGYSNAWKRINTYSGKLAENVTSAVARDVLLNRMPDVEKAGFGIIMRVHDEFVTIAPDKPNYTWEKLASIMSEPFEWSVGLPLAAAGYEAKRYRKD